MKTILVVLCVAALASGELCSLRGDCKACLVDTGCSYALVSTPGQEKQHVCVDSKVSGKDVNILMRYRDIDDCDDSEQMTSDDAADNQNMSAEMDMMTAKDDIKCPIATPLMIAFVISLILLATILSAVVTIACWVSVCGPEDGQSSYRYKKPRRKVEEQMAEQKV